MKRQNEIVAKMDLLSEKKQENYYRNRDECNFIEWLKSKQQLTINDRGIPES